MLDHIAENLSPAPFELSELPLQSSNPALVAMVIDLGFYNRQLDQGFADAQAAAEHYLSSGWRQGLDPTPWFSTNAYLADHPDVSAADFPAFLHYIRHGAAEKRVIRRSGLGNADL